MNSTFIAKFFFTILCMFVTAILVGTMTHIVPAVLNGEISRLAVGVAAAAGAIVYGVMMCTMSVVSDVLNEI